MKEQKKKKKRPYYSKRNLKVVTPLEGKEKKKIQTKLDFVWISKNGRGKGHVLSCVLGSAHVLVARWRAQSTRYVFCSFRALVETNRYNGVGAV